MNENTEKLIRELADKLGTTAERLWSALVRQAPIEAVTSIICWLFAILILGYAFRRIRKIDEEDSVRLVCMALWAAATLAYVAMLYHDFPLILAGFFNPEYWALKEIIK